MVKVPQVWGEKPQSLERKNWMERSNQPPKPKCCLQRGQEPESQGMTEPNDLREAYTGQKRGPQAGFASWLSNYASKCSAADGDGLGMPETNTDGAVSGEALEGLPGPNLTSSS